VALKKQWAPWAIAATLLATAIGGLVAGWWVVAGLAFVGGAAAAGFGYRARKRKVEKKKSVPTPQPVPRRAAPAADDRGGLAEQMIAQGRYTLLLRPQVIKNLSEELELKTWETLRSEMALVPEGEVVIDPAVGFLEDDFEDEKSPSESAPAPHIARVQALFMDRHAVTNRQYQEFVDGGGYEEMAIWDPQILPAVLDFVDSTGSLGPRYWKNGQYPPGEDDLPVVGVSWYEAAAYARWVGKRLPLDAEWVKTASWPVPTSSGVPAQRKYPWGDSMDRERCNLWGSGPGLIVPVTEYPDGMSVGGVHQLIGNVWEWTGGNFGANYAKRGLLLPAPMKSIRGGAYDTYFESQATCQFESGENPVARKHNIGFRCAASLSDLASRAAALSMPEADEAAPHPNDVEGANA